MSNESATVKDVVRRHWSDRAATFDTGLTHGLHSDAQRDAWTRCLARWAGSDSVDVLDVGCGTGFLALQLATLGHRVTGVDLSPAMLDLARTKAASAHLTARFEIADGEQLPFPSISFDLVVQRHVIWTLPAPAEALLEWRRVLRPGGGLVLIEGDWRPGSAQRNDDYTEIRDALPLYDGRPSTVLAALVGDAGFAPVQVEPLMNSDLWGAAPDAERYAIVARVPENQA